MKQSFILAIGAFCMIIAQYLIFYYAPIEQTMGYAQKIFYYHLPVAWWSFVGFFVSFVGAILYLATKQARYDRLSVAGAEIGFLLASLALVTGSIWGRYSWGVWWTWDPRLTTMLVLWFIFAAYLVVRTMPMPKARLASVSAVISIIGFLDVPLVFLSARFWRTIHPSVFASKGGGLETEMLHTVLFCVFTFTFIFIPLIVYRMKAHKQAHEMDRIRTHMLYEEE